jgi:hypothetical protein
MEVTGQIYDPVFTFGERTRGAPWMELRVCPRVGASMSKIRQISALLGTETRFLGRPAHSLVTILSENKLLLFTGE